MNSLFPMRFPIYCLSASLLCSSVALAQAPTITGVFNDGDNSTRLSPGVLVQITGTNFGPTVKFSVGGKAAFVSPSLVGPSLAIDVEIPTDAPAGASTIIATVGNASSAPFSITLDAYAPAFFNIGNRGGGDGAAVRTVNIGLGVTPLSPAISGDLVSVYAVGLGPTNPPTPTGPFPNKPLAPTATAPTLTVGGVDAKINYAGGAPGEVGLYEILFTVPAGLQGTLPMVLSIAGKSTAANVTIPLAGITSVVNNASFSSSGTASPGSIVSVFANGIGSVSQLTGFPDTAFQGYSVLFNGIPAPLFHLVGSAGQIDLLVPYELPSSGTVNVQLKTPTATLTNFPVTMVPASPGLYTLNDPSVGARFNVIAQFNATAWLAMPDSMASALKIPGNCAAAMFTPLSLCGQPASAGDYLVLYTTGLGKATPNGDPNGVQLRSGDVPPADGSVLYKTVETPTVTVGGLPANVVFCGISPGFPGLYQVDFQVPSGVSGDDVPLQVMIGGKSDLRTIAIRSK